MPYIGRYPIMTRLVFLPALLVMALILTGCAGLDNDVSRTRTPLENLGHTAAEAVLKDPHWPGNTRDRVLLVAPATMAGNFGSRADDRFNDALIRGLLSARDGPQVLSVNEDDPAHDDAPDNQWRLTSTLSAPLGAIALSDRLLYPYALTLMIKRADSDAVWWQHDIDGAFDERGLYLPSPPDEPLTGTDASSPSS